MACPSGRVTGRSLKPTELRTFADGKEGQQGLFKKEKTSTM